MGLELAARYRVQYPAAVVTLALVSLSGCLVPLGAPPLRADLAPATAISGDGANTGVRAAVGVSLASATTDPAQRHDVTAGYVYERLGAPPADSDRLDLRVDGTRSLHGGFAEYGQLLSLDGNQRAWISGRGELLYDTGVQGGLAWGASARASWELFSSGSGSAPMSSRCATGVGMRTGTTAIGVYVEGGYRHLPDQGPAMVATAGVSLRLPALAMVALVIPLPGC